MQQYSENQRHLKHFYQIQSLKKYNNAGRLWAYLIQIEHLQSENGDLSNAYDTFQKALQQVPKSGEVWCEGARICLNNLGNLYNIEKARFFLKAALHFTPQYGDSFIEYLKLTMIENNKSEKKKIKLKAFADQPNYGNLWNFQKTCLNDCAEDIWKNIKQQLKNQKSQNTFNICAIKEFNDNYDQNKVQTECQRIKLIFSLDQSLVIQN